MIPWGNISTINMGEIWKRTQKYYSKKKPHLGKPSNAQWTTSNRKVILKNTWGRRSRIHNATIRIIRMSNTRKEIDNAEKSQSIRSTTNTGQTTMGKRQDRKYKCAYKQRSKIPQPKNNNKTAYINTMRGARNPHYAIDPGGRIDRRKMIYCNSPHAGNNTSKNTTKYNKRKQEWEDLKWGKGNVQTKQNLIQHVITKRKTPSRRATKIPTLAPEERKITHTRIRTIGIQRANEQRANT